MLLKINKLAKSEKGDAVILLSVIVTGMIMLASAVAVERLSKSTVVQNAQKASVDSLYKAEEGIEYSLYVNKEKIVGTKSSDYSISVWDENSNNIGQVTDKEVLEMLAQPVENSDTVITSENELLENDRNQIKRTVFANLPSRYYNQITLWEAKSGCGTGGCTVIEDGSEEYSKGETFAALLTTADFQKDGWDKDHTKYRIVVNCGGGKDCEVKDLKIGVNCDVTQCQDNYGCTLKEINILNGSSSKPGIIITSEWFQFPEGSSPSGNKLDLRNSNIIVQFTLEKGSLKGLSGLAGGGVKMCRKKKNESVWTPYTDTIMGLMSLEFKKIP